MKITYYIMTIIIELIFFSCIGPIDHYLFTFLFLLALVAGAITGRRYIRPGEDHARDALWGILYGSITTVILFAGFWAFIISWWF